MTDRSTSEFELKAIRPMQDSYDVVILGGGLAGLTLGLQLKRRRPETSVLIAEKRADPPPVAAFKVGESTVEVGAYYYREMVGMADHLNEKQLRKAGLRFFMPAGDNSDITRRVEYVTPDQYFNHQIDRGIFENELYNRCVKAGVDVFRGCRVQNVEIGGDQHTVEILREGGATATVQARWVSDCSGRANILRRKLGLETETGHVMNSAWFRLAGGMDIEDWTDDQDWINRVDERGFRALATIHLIDTGYWVWLIPLSSGNHSIGVVADPRFHPFDQINEFDRMMGWFREHEPQLAQALEGREGDIMDFLVVENFSYGTSRVFSNDRWTLNGEAAAFADALYSPGSDFIGYTNNFSTDLICRSLDGEDVEERLEFYNFFYYQLFDPTIGLYKDNYHFFGNPQVMLAKLLYDTVAYFCTLPYIFMHDKMTDLDVLADVVDDFQTILPLLARMQEFFKQWHQLDQTKWEGVSVLSKHFEGLAEKQRALSQPFTDEEFKARAIDNLEMVKATATWLFHKGAQLLPEAPDPNRRINVMGISLKPEMWEEEGLFDESGMTLAEAEALTPGIEEYWLEGFGAKVATT